jgi:hypothetical protein
MTQNRSDWLNSQQPKQWLARFAVILSITLSPLALYQLFWA